MEKIIAKDDFSEFSEIEIKSESDNYDNTLDTSFKLRLKDDACIDDNAFFDGIIES